MTLRMEVEDSLWSDIVKQYASDLDNSVASAG